MIISKYRLYAILLLSTAAVFFAPGVFRILADRRAEGVVTKLIVVQSPPGEKRNDIQYAVVTFRCGNQTVRYQTSLLTGHLYKVGQVLPVLYSAKDPAYAHVYSFMGIFAKPLVFVIPIVIVLSAAFFMPGAIPYQIRLKPRAGIGR